MPGVPAGDHACLRSPVLLATLPQAGLESGAPRPPRPDIDHRRWPGLLSRVRAAVHGISPPSAYAVLQPSLSRPRVGGRAGDRTALDRTDRARSAKRRWSLTDRALPRVRGRARPCGRWPGRDSRRPQHLPARRWPGPPVHRVLALRDVADGHHAGGPDRAEPDRSAGRLTDATASTMDVPGLSPAARRGRRWRHPGRRRPAGRGPHRGRPAHRDRHLRLVPPGSAVDAKGS